MFAYCSNLTNLDLSKFNTDKVEEIDNMFYNCFKEEQTSTLICTASTIQKITTKETSYLKITDDKEEAKKINDKLKGNLEQVCTCSVKRVGNNPEITEVEEYQITSVVEYKQK
jgi:surface protein